MPLHTLIHLFDRSIRIFDWSALFTYSVRNIFRDFSAPAWPFSVTFSFNGVERAAGITPSVAPQPHGQEPGKQPYVDLTKLPLSAGANTVVLFQLACNDALGCNILFFIPISIRFESLHHPLRQQHNSGTIAIQ